MEGKVHYKIMHDHRITDDNFYSYSDALKYALTLKGSVYIYTFLDGRCTDLEQIYS